MAEGIKLTKEGYEAIEAELDELVNVKRGEISERLKEAISYGDISENSEYDTAKNEQAELEDKISKLENIIKNAVIISDSEEDADTIGLGRKFKVKDVKKKQELEYIIVASAEANPLAGKISNESPVGAALLGHKAGDKLTVDVPGGSVKYEVISIG
jgi:transcription elongation factor GreA